MYAQLSGIDILILKPIVFLRDLKMIKKCMIALAAVIPMVSVASAADSAIQAIDLCKFPVYMGTGYYVQLPEYNNCMSPVYTDVGYYVKLKDCDLRKLNLVQIDCEDIGKSAEDFPCFAGCEDIEVRANFPAIFGGRLTKIGPILTNVSVFWNDDINKIDGTGDWEKLTICMNAWKAEILMAAEPDDILLVGEITIITNLPPVADAGPDQTVYTEEGGIAQVTLDGSGSSDPDGDELTYEWTWSIGGDTYNATGINPIIELPIGEHIIQLIVNDGIIDSEPDYVEITILPNLSGWVYMLQDVPGLGYSLNEADLVYFYSFDFVQSFNITTGGWSVHMPMGYVYFDWPFYFELVPGTPGILWFAFPPAGGIGVYHNSTGQWELLPRIIPW